MSYNYTNLVFEGGGVRGSAYAGVLKVLADPKYDILDSITRVAGTSAGSIAATLVSLGYTPEEAHSILGNLDFSKFLSGWDPLRIPDEYGLYDGDYFLNWLKDLIAGKVPASSGGGNATFTDLNALGLRDLHVIATDLNIYGVQEFSFAATPTVPVAEAVRASMSIPLLFKAWKFSNNNPNDHIYVDGGTVLNYPITIFDSGDQPNPQTLGFFFYDTVQKTNDLKYWELLKYAQVLFETLLEAQDIDIAVDPTIQVRTVRINDFGIAATDFKYYAGAGYRIIPVGYQLYGTIPR